MSSDFSPALRAELLDDFYAECDDLLAHIRAQLVTLDRSLASATPDDAALESLYRSVHSFKGNAAIVGLAPAEQLAHAAENLLRSLSRHETPLTAATLELLGHVAHRLEQLATTHRLQQPAPEIQPLLDALAAFQPRSASSALPPAAAAPVESAKPAEARGGWRARFTPSPERDARGVNVNTVRARLAALGEIVRAAPAIESGAMSFDFDLAVSSPPPDLAAWEADGVVWQPPAS
ncbi:MAG TPA: Hpt domain-containing protein, partial [Opitutaceae bacterium]|nr:Hpt domain-containing protein [Opitutaceae bacterium]